MEVAAAAAKAQRQPLFEKAPQNFILHHAVKLTTLDLDYLMTFYAEDFQTADADGKCQLDNAQAISSILRESRNHETDHPFIYPADRNSSSVSEQEDEWER